MSDSALKDTNHSILLTPSLHSKTSTNSKPKPTLPLKSGVSLKPEHYKTIIDQGPDIGWFEIHPENYMGVGGAPHQYLSQIRDNYALSMHGVGLSLGSSTGLDKGHLKNLKQLVDRYQPEQVSEHLSWSHWNQQYFNDLLPLQLTKESFNLIRDNINQVQDFLQRSILIENPSTYIEFKTQELSETEFLNALCKDSGCGILLDVNNVSVCSFNHSQNPVAGSTRHILQAERYLRDINYEHVGEIHLAGHALMNLIDDKHIRIDDHGSQVSDEVWSLYDYALSQSHCPIATLVEWDTNIPSLDVLLSEAAKVDTKLMALPDSLTKSPRY